MDNIYIPHTVIKNFECVLCNKHVFVPPITTKDGTSFKCGRCSSINSDHPVRTNSLEKLASFMKFPCTFEGCDATIPWGKVTDHEQLCNYRVIDCPSGHCRDIYPINKMVSHFDEKHKNYMSTNEYQLDCIAFGAHLKLILFKQLPYLLYFYENKVNIWISVYSVSTKDDVLFQVQFHGSNTNKSLIFQADVIPFNDREHCLNCLHHICNNNYHKYSKVNSNYDIINESMTFNIEKSYLMSVLDSKKVSYTVNIRKLKEDSSQEAIVKNLECPVCQVPMSAPIYNCQRGHAICTICKKKLAKCSLCQSRLTDSRCFALEGIAQSIQMSCCNKKNGCPFTGNVDQCLDHEDACLVPSL